MAGDASNARLWADADVYVSFDLDAPTPATAETAFSAAWDLVGLLDGDAGFTESRSQDATDHFAWGNILVRTGRRNYKETHSFTALEWNDTTRRLYRPGSDTPGTWKVALRPERIKVAFEVREGEAVQRLISTYQAEITVDGDVNRNESNLSNLSFLATIFPTADGDLWTVQELDLDGS